MYFIVRVTSSQEKITTDILENKVVKTGLPVFSIVLVGGMKGYLIIEAENENACRDLIANEPHVKGMLKSELKEEEFNKMLEVKQEVQNIGVNDTIEFIAGPFKGYKAKVIKTDSLKDDITVELMDVAVQIPVTTKSNTARLIAKAEKNE
jgi:transcriptional antiterminator NusG